MSSIEGLKEQARRHEQKEEWGKALELYGSAIDKLAEQEQPDIGLYNRVGDLYTRTGDNDKAVDSYESAVDLYLEADLPNNAIAVCKKILRNLPDRHRAFLRMGQIRASQGFLVDARQNFLTYAERMQTAGNMDEALRALVEFADLAPEDTDIRMAIATQYEQHERTEEAIEQLVSGHAILQTKGDAEGAELFAAKVRELGPDGADTRLAGGAVEAEDHAFASFGDIEPDSDFGAYGSDIPVEAEESHDVDVTPESDDGVPDASEDDGFEVAAEFSEISLGGDDAAIEAAGDADAPSHGDALAIDDEGASAADEDAPIELESTDFADIPEGGDLPGFDDSPAEEATDDDVLGGFTLDFEDESPADGELEGVESTAPAGPATTDSDTGFVEADEAPVGESEVESTADDFDEAAAELEAMAAQFGGFEAEAAPIGAHEDEDEDEDVPEGGDLPLMFFGDDEEAAEETSDELPTLSDETPAHADEASTSSDELPTLSDETPAHADGASTLSEELPTLSGDAGDEEEVPVDDVPVPAAGSDSVVEAETEAEGEIAAEIEQDDQHAAEPVADAIAGAIEEQLSEDRETPEPVSIDPATDAAVTAPDLADSDDPRDRYEALEARASDAPFDVELRQRMLEVAYLVNDDQVLAGAYLGLANALREAGKDAKAQAMYQQVLSVDPDNADAQAALEASRPATRPISEVTASEEYVDLGSLILGDEDEKTTRFTVAYEEPTGDEDADFAKMLSQFKAKVAENFDASDVKGHHDLGTAYKEMGLLDEAIQEFQQALRASADHLPTYELLGQTFMEKGEFPAAARVLKRALEADWEVEDELLGIYYYLGRVHEELGEPNEAADFYDQVFSLDINFADVTERLRKLR